MHSRPRLAAAPGAREAALTGPSPLPPPLFPMHPRAFESPQRPLLIWALDVGKQSLGMLAAHACGIAAAMLIARMPRGGAASECSWYFFAFLADTSIGLGLSLAMHWAVMWAARRIEEGPLLEIETLLLPCGDYGARLCLKSRAFLGGWEEGGWNGGRGRGGWPGAAVVPGNAPCLGSGGGEPFDRGPSTETGGRAVEPGR